MQEQSDGRLAVRARDGSYRGTISPIAAHVWSLCDGATDLAVIAESLGRFGDDYRTRGAVVLALHRLSEADLLTTPMLIPGAPRTTRARA